MLGMKPGAYGTGYLTGAVAQGRENYYTGAVAQGEPPGVWHGRGAAKLGLAGQVDAQVMTDLYDRMLDPRDQAGRKHLGSRPARYANAAEKLDKLLAQEPDATPERRAELALQAAPTGKNAVAFYDATFNCPKSVTILHTAFERMEVQARVAGDEQAAAAWQTHREAVEAAIWSGVKAGLDYLEDEAGYSRVGHNGLRRVDAHEFTVASFLQHTNREGEPHLHVHNAILNRVECPDGKYRAIDGKQLIAHRPAASAIADRTMEEQITATLGVRFATRPDGKAREVVGISPAVTAMFSERRRQVAGKLVELVGRFERDYGRTPNALETDRLSQIATLATRKAKGYSSESRDEQLEKFDRQLREQVADGLKGVARGVLGRAGGTGAATFSEKAVIEVALAAVQGDRAHWTRADLTRAVDEALPDHLGGLSGAQVRQLVVGLTNKALQCAEYDNDSGGAPGGTVTTGGAVSLTYQAAGAATTPTDHRLANGLSAYANPIGPKYATVGHLTAEYQLRRSAVERGAATVDRNAAQEWLATFKAGLATGGRVLGVDQEAAIAGILTNGARIEALIGPAGTGKTFVVGAVNEAWRELAGGRVFGLAVSENATQLLAEEGLEARNVTRWLNAQERLAEGRGWAEDEAYRLTERDVVMVDESGMADRESVSRVHAYAAAAGAKMLLAGDHRQLSAVGAGGTFAMLADHGISYELAEVRRFAAQWERDASLGLRAGDPKALLDYAKHGRLVDGGTVEQAAQKAVRGYLGDYLAGHRTLLIVDTNEQAAQLSAQVRAELVRLGRVAEAGAWLGLQRTGVGVGDVVQARLNARSLVGYEGNERGPINREMYRVDGVRDDGGLVVTPLAGGSPIALSPGYVAGHLALGYATTGYGAQGQTVYSGHAVVTGGTELTALYPALTRGTHGNTAYVATIATDPDAPGGAAHDVERLTPTAVIAAAMATAETEQAALVEMELSEADARSIQTLGDRFADGVELATAGRPAALFDRLYNRGILTGAQREALAADEAVGVLGRLVRTVELAGHDVEATLTEAAQQRSLDDAGSIAQVLHHRVSGMLRGKLAPAGDSYADRIPHGISEQGQVHLTALAEAADERRRELGFEVAERAPQWAVEAFGPVPADVIERAEWEHRASIVAAHRDLTGHLDEAEAIGPAPKIHDTEDRASWYAAWRALGRPEADREEAELTEGQLRVRAQAYEREEKWAPAYVADEMAEANQTAANERASAELARAAGRAGDAEQHETRAAEAAQRAADLEVVDQARAEWYAETAATRAAALRAREELAARNVPVDAEDDRTTPDEWLAAERDARVQDDPHRVITEVDVDDEKLRADDQAAADARDKQAAAAEAQAQRTVAEEVERAQKALAELEDRRSAEQAKQAAEEADRAEELARYQAEEEEARRARQAQADDQYEFDQYDMYTI